MWSPNARETWSATEPVGPVYGFLHGSTVLEAAKDLAPNFVKSSIWSLVTDVELGGHVVLVEVPDGSDSVADAPFEMTTAAVVALGLGGVGDGVAGVAELQISAQPVEQWAPKFARLRWTASGAVAELGGAEAEPET